MSYKTAPLKNKSRLIYMEEYSTCDLLYVVIEQPYMWSFVCCALLSLEAPRKQVSSLLGQCSGWRLWAVTIMGFVTQDQREYDSWCDTPANSLSMNQCWCIVGPARTWWTSIKPTLERCLMFAESWLKRICPSSERWECAPLYVHCGNIVTKGNPAGTTPYSILMVHSMVDHTNPDLFNSSV